MNMNEEIELRLLREIEELKRQLNTLKGEDNSGIISYNFSNIKFKDLKSVFELKLEFNNDIFNNWFENSIVLDNEVIDFLVSLLNKEGKYLKYYNEENLKIKFLTPILNSVDFNIEEANIKDFYEEKFSYETEKFILNGVIDFTVSKGEINSEKPYFFIQEFKKGKVISDPEPQLLAELISAVELNDWNTIRGAYIVGAIWNFVILERLEKHKYQYYVSQNFDSTKIEDLKDIYKNLVFVKNEIIEMIKEEEKVS
jgi:hypothetical protein